MKKKEIKKKYNLKGFWSYFFKFSNVKSPYVWFFTLLQVLKPAFLALQPYIIVRVMSAFNNQDYDYALNLIIIFIVSSILSNITTSLGIDLSSKYNTVRLVEFNEQWMTKLTSHSNSFFQNKFGGSLTSNYVALQGGLEGLWGILFEQLPGFIVQLVSILVVSIFYNKMLGLVMALYLVVFIILFLQSPLN